MSVSSVTDPAQGLAQYFQRIQSERQTQSAATSGGGATVAAYPSTATTSVDAQGAQASRPHHHGHGGGVAMRGKIESAVTDALNSYNGSGDVNQMIQDAVKAAVQSGAQSADQTSTTTAATTPTDPPTTAASQSQDEFQQLLASHGVDASQFRDDIFAGFKSARGNETESSGALTALPPGSYVDEQG